MCGIIGYVGNKNAVPIIVEGLKKLEYRGYDSAGLAVYTSGSFEVIKKKGRLSVLENEIEKKNICGFVGVGHTRWATHGEPSNENSHPHLGFQNKIAVVHNGIIENYVQLREELTRTGIKFSSETDSEVVAQLAEYYYKSDIVETVIKVANRLEGSYALGIMCLDEPETIIAIKKDNPLIVGAARHGHFIASDVPAVLNHTDKVYYLEDKEIAVLREGSVEFLNIVRARIQKQPETITWSADSAEKGGYPHFMLKEIFEQPKVLEDTIQSMFNDGNNKKVIENLNFSKFNKVVITACGSAYNAGVVAKYVFEHLCRTPAEVEFASEFRYKNPIVDENSLVILVSQSGETADTIAALREAKSKGAATLSIVNVVGSTIAKEAGYCLYTAAGPEIAVATTKAFSTQLTLLYFLAIRFAVQSGRLSESAGLELLAELRDIPQKVTEVLKNVDFIQKYASNCIGYKSIFFIGRNIDYAIALEGSLKLKEISYIHSEAYAGGELKHGTISLIEEGTLVVALSNCERLYRKIMSNVEQVASRGGEVLFVGSCPIPEPNKKLSYIGLPEGSELFSPSLSVIVLQLFSYCVAANKGLDIDKPRNLAKSVTVE